MLEQIISRLGINVYFIPAALICVTVHECSHGFAAMKLGDPTAKELGRITLNPIKHIDLVGFLMLVFLGFGWAKPVPVDMRYFKKPKRDMAITAFAGPLSNFLLALIFLFALAVFVYVGPAVTTFTTGVYNVIFYTAMLSIGLGVFNLLPVSPLDGSKIFLSFLPDKIYYQILRFERYGMILLVLLMFTGILDTPMVAVRTWIFDSLWWLVRLPFGF